MQKWDHFSITCDERKVVGMNVDWLKDKPNLIDFLKKAVTTDGSWWAHPTPLPEGMSGEGRDHMPESVGRIEINPAVRLC